MTLMSFAIDWKDDAPKVVQVAALEVVLCAVPDGSVHLRLNVCVAAALDRSQLSGAEMRYAAPAGAAGVVGSVIGEPLEPIAVARPV